MIPDLPQKWREVHQKSLAGEDKGPFLSEDGIDLGRPCTNQGSSIRKLLMR